MDESPPSPLAEPAPWNLVADGYDQVLFDQFGPYSERALELARLSPESQVLDVACGPGTLCMRAASRVRRVTGLDFSERMLAQLRRRCADAGLDNVELHVGDGQQLPFDDASFDGAFSMFGLMFFPDRQRGFRELHRVLRPGARAVNASWVPFEEVPTLSTVFAAIAELLPNLPIGKGPAPLSSREAIEEEMTYAGFRDVEVHRVTYALNAASLEDFWQDMLASNVALVMIRRKLGEQWPGFASRLVGRLADELGEGPVHAEMPALLGVGKAS